MTDLGRKNLSDKLNESVTPDSQKTTYDKAKETVTDKLDSFAARNTPDNQKSFSQTVADKAQIGSEDAKEAAGQKQESLSETASGYVEQAKEAIGNAAEYVSGVVSGANEGAKTGAEATKK
ncbi:heat shock protein 9/12-domain-containing protein [Scheffersomyces amazonensis]|uniref:heat shock protein 9/12-domain-containing protein n=1 Tax=Scheffersomyces amazonensis TaxID=1078765 RepID=UPI00315CDB2C